VLLTDALSDVGVCVKDAHGRVSQQDSLCKGLCGDLAGEICEKGCMRLYAKHPALPALSEGARVFNSQKIKNTLVDWVVINNGETITTLIYPLTRRSSALTQVLSSAVLSKNEFQIVQLIIDGFTNPEICAEVDIALPTLRTHMANIYRKLPPEVAAAFRRWRTQKTQGS